LGYLIENGFLEETRFLEQVFAKLARDSSNLLIKLDPGVV
jgi:hypothetical protein